MERETGKDQGFLWQARRVGRSGGPPLASPAQGEVRLRRLACGGKAVTAAKCTYCSERGLPLAAVTAFPRLRLPRLRQSRGLFRRNAEGFLCARGILERSGSCAQLPSVMSRPASIRVGADSLSPE